MKTKFMMRKDEGKGVPSRDINVQEDGFTILGKPTYFSGCCLPKFPFPFSAAEASSLSGSHAPRARHALLGNILRACDDSTFT